MHLTNGSLLFSGKVWFQQEDGTEDSAYTEVTAYDHLIYLTKRMCKTPQSFAPAHQPNHIDWVLGDEFEPGPCNLADPTKVIEEYVTGPLILKAFIDATNDCDGASPISVASAAGGGPDLTGFPVDWPMDIGTFANILLETGQLDIVVNPGYGASSVNLYNGDYGTDRTGSVIFNYGTGSFNSRAVSRTSDMEDLTNALWYLLGPKRPQFNQDIQHWAGSLTPSGPHDIDTWVDPADLTPPRVSHPYHQWDPSRSLRWNASRGVYGYMQEIQIHDSKEDENDIRFLFERMYNNEAYIRALPRTFVSASPDRSTAAPSFFVGDRISITAGSMIGGGLFGGSMRVYSYTYNIDTDGVGEITEIDGSADQE